MRLNGAQALVRCLAAEQVGFAFGIASGKLTPLLHALSLTPQIRFVGLRHEAAGAMMAAAVFAGSGRVALALGEMGPGGLNLAAGAGVAFNNNLAALLVTTNQHHAAAYPHRGMFMDRDTRAVFAPLTKNGQPAIYTQNSLLNLTLSHLLIVAIATLGASVLAVGLAILVTRPAGMEFLPLSRMISNVGQTFPPVAVLALAVPVLGFGTAPTLVALFLYGLLPIFENALTGLTTISPEIEESARGTGMTEWQRLTQIELPLALPLILAGLRLSVTISIGTATIGSTVAASTLGEAIIAGLINSNLAFVAQGGLVVGVLAILIYDALRALECRIAKQTGMAVR